jgi:hypothetical protein
MNAYCEKQGKEFSSTRFMYDGCRLNPDETPEKVKESVFNTLHKIQE